MITIISVSIHFRPYNKSVIVFRMTPEEKSLLERTYKMAEDNNRLLRKIRRSGIYSSVIKTIYWIVIIGVTLGAYYYLQPYLNSMMNIIHQAQDTMSKLNGVSNPFK